MATIDITTAQKITITFDLASFWERTLALLLDLVFIGTYVIIMVLAGALLVPALMENYIYALILPVIIFYSLAFEIFNRGQSPGKMILGIRVVKTDGRPPAPIDFLIRWAFRPVDIWVSFGTVALILISSSEKNQRLGDLLANTGLIRTRVPVGQTLAGIVNMQKREDYRPVHSNVTRLTETDMLQVKTLLDRLKRHPNESHYHALDIASQRVADKLEMTLPPYHPYFSTNPFIRSDERSKRVAFLQEVLKDYIILTR